MRRVLPLAALAGLVVAPGPACAQSAPHDGALGTPMQAAIHPVGDAGALQAWLSRVPVTRDFPADFTVTMRELGSVFLIETTTARGCVPCGDIWGKLSTLGRRYGWQVRTISRQDAVVRSGHFGLPWVGHPVVWVRPIGDEVRMVPVAMGTDHAANLARNLYLAAKILTGVKPAVGVRAMSKFTGIVGLPATSPGKD
ncbi:hypothetical protein HT136_03230 [Novosphingobium profundi]|uniref:hypothetical protein n=1 Tax=Novosphingobium profundi TaxID=1774954 RepID=UPI001BD95AB0|nr:hypothetical protein [Novosphingobium profundi]MBT0667377.1 hypothetical protein [Novosphingobium profundi]